MIAGGAAGLLVGLWFLAGAAIELFNAWTRRRSAEGMSPEQKGRAVGWLALGFAVRVVLTAGVLVLAFRHSFVSGLLAWLGYYVCRTAMMWRTARRLKRDSSAGSKDG
jgi:hypothetical protein